jgi:hypothetical protein
MTKEMFTVTDADIKDLTKLIKEKGQVTDAAQDTFCKIWPQAKTALELLGSFISAIPGVGLFAKAAITIVIAAGEAAAKAVCK